MSSTRIVAAVVDTSHVIFYKDTGETVVMNQGDPRIRPALEKASVDIPRFGYCEVGLDTKENTYAKFEEESKGAVRFFRIAKEKLKSFFKPKTGVLGVVPVNMVPQPVQQQQSAEPVDGSEPDWTHGPTEEVTLRVTKETAEVIQQNQAAVAEILQHAVSVKDEKFTERGLTEQRPIVEDDRTPNTMPDESSTDTIIAVTQDNKIVPGMELIKSQFARASKMGSTQGVEAFLKRLGAVIKERKHSVEDLLKFMERGDLPIADDGSIIIYKVLATKPGTNRTDGRYVDCHTKKVEQWAGAYVCMDHSLVDHNRNNECSNGLHVARRGYVRQFSGDVCVIAKLAPEDVIAVPTYDANKMRVCGYHILMELTNAQFSLLKANRPLTEDPEGKILLANALAGKHIGKTHEVRITGHNGTGVVVTTLEKPKEQKVEKAITPVEALNNQSEEQDNPIDPKAVAEEVAQVTEKTQKSRKEIAAELYAAHKAGDKEAMDKLVAFKKTCKTSWENLGLPNLFKPEAKEVSKTPTKAPKTPSKAPQKAEAPKDLGSPRERIQKLLALGTPDAVMAQKIWDIKKAAKKSWEALGVAQPTVDVLVKVLGK